MTTYIFTLTGTEETGFEASKGAFYKPDKVVDIWEKYLVLKRAGYSENPGSRYSGFMSYYPPEISVYEIIEWLGPRRIRAIEITSWETGRKTKVINPDDIFAKRLGKSS